MMAVFIKKYLFIFILLWSSLAQCADFNACQQLWMRYATDYRNYWSPAMQGFSGETSQRPKQLFILSFGQSHLNTPAQIDAIKKDMQNDRFDYESSRISMSGDYSQRHNTLIVNEGHHRFAAALEIAYETGSWVHFNRLIANGVWKYVSDIPNTSSPLPMRQKSLPFSKWSKFLKSLRPPRFLQ
jgi:hypothetical protein